MARVILGLTGEFTRRRLIRDIDFEIVLLNSRLNDSQVEIITRGDRFGKSFEEQITEYNNFEAFLTQFFAALVDFRAKLVLIPGITEFS